MIGDPYRTSPSLPCPVCMPELSRKREYGAWLERGSLNMLGKLVVASITR